MTTEKLRNFRVIKFVSSSRINGDLDFPHPIYPERVLPENYIQYDTASYKNVHILNIKNETFGEIERPLEEMLEHDIIVKMLPKNRFTVKGRITRIRKAEPRVIVEDEDILLEL